MLSYLFLSIHIHQHSSPSAQLQASPHIFADCTAAPFSSPSIGIASPFHFLRPSGYHPRFTFFAHQDSIPISLSSPIRIASPLHRHCGSSDRPLDRYPPWHRGKYVIFNSHAFSLISYLLYNKQNFMAIHFYSVRPLPPLTIVTHEKYHSKYSVRFPSY